MIVKIALHKAINISSANPSWCAGACEHLEGLKIGPYCHLFLESLVKDTPELQVFRCRACLHAWDDRLPEPKPCHDCNAAPGECHKSGCDTEQCSVCGGQRISCDCQGHDPQFARWSGWWPGLLEARALGIDMNRFHSEGWAAKLFIKPDPIEETQSGYKIKVSVTSNTPHESVTHSKVFNLPFLPPPGLIIEDGEICFCITDLTYDCNSNFFQGVCESEEEPDLAKTQASYAAAGWNLES